MSVATRLIALMLTVAVAAVLPNPSAGAITDGYPDSGPTPIASRKLGEADR